MIPSTATRREKLQNINFKTCKLRQVSHICLYENYKSSIAVFYLIIAQN